MSNSDWLGTLGLAFIGLIALSMYLWEPTLPVTTPDDAPESLERWLP